MSEAAADRLRRLRRTDSEVKRPATGQQRHAVPAGSLSATCLTWSTAQTRHAASTRSVATPPRLDIEVPRS